MRTIPHPGFHSTTAPAARATRPRTASASAAGLACGSTGARVRLAFAALLLAFGLLLAPVAHADHVGGHGTPCDAADTVGGGQLGLSPGPTGPPDSDHLGWDVGSGQCNGSFTVADDAGFTGGHIELGLRAEQRSVGQVARTDWGDYTVQLGTDTTQPNASRAWWNFQASIAYNGVIDDLDSLTLTIETVQGTALPPTPVVDLLTAGLRSAIDDRQAGSTPTSGFSDLYQISQNPLFGWLDECDVDGDCTTGVCSTASTGMCLSQEGAWRLTLAATEGADTVSTTVCIHTPGACCAATRYVETTGDDTSNDCSDAGAPCATIQHGVDVACDGDTVTVGAGTFPEQVAIAKPVTIQGAGKGVTIVAPTAAVANTTSLSTAAAAAAIILADGAAGIDINDLTVDGGPAAFNACSPSYFGIFYRNASGTTDTVHVTNVFHPSAVGCQGVVGILAQSGGAGSATVTVNDSMVDVYGKNGITCNEAATTCTLTGNMVTGRGPVPLGDAAQNGIQIAFGAGGSVVANEVHDNFYVPKTFCAAGVLALSDDLLIQDNVLDGNLCDLLAQGSDSDILGNVIDPALDFPFSILGDDNTIAMNVVSGSPEVGVYNDGTGNAYTCNRITNNNGGFFFDNFSGPGTPNVINMNSIFGNGVGVDATAVSAPPDVDATDNWWGCPAGPGNAGCDTVTINVDASSPAAAPPACVACSSDTDCDDTLACNGAETCNLGTGMCEPGTAVVCDDGNDCTSDVCTEPSGTCTFTPVADGSPCDDGDICSVPDSCQSGSCAAGGGGDPDSDGICSVDDNCPSDANPGQDDLDSDGEGDVCDLDDAPLSISNLQIRRSRHVGIDRGSVKVKGDFFTLPPEDFPATPKITIEVEDSLGFTTSHTWTLATDCVVRNGRVKCQSADKRFKSNFKPFSQTPGVFRYVINFRKQAIAPDTIFAGPLSATLTSGPPPPANGSIDRPGTISDCRQISSGIKCREF